jgi:hypothetical protein
MTCSQMRPSRRWTRGGGWRSTSIGKLCDCVKKWKEIQKCSMRICAKVGNFNGQSQNWTTAKCGSTSDGYE